MKELEAGVIRPSTSPWASPIMIVKKKDGGLQFCVDYQLSKFDAYRCHVLKKYLRVLALPW